LWKGARSTRDVYLGAAQMKGEGEESPTRPWSALGTLGKPHM
jgi:hypothetical protein